LQAVKCTAKPIWVCAEEGTVISILSIGGGEAVIYEILGERNLTLLHASELNASTLCSGKAETVFQHNDEQGRAENTTLLNTAQN
jgi:hypothetical protein